MNPEQDNFHNPHPHINPQQPRKNFWFYATFPVRWFWGSLSHVGKIRFVSLLTLFAVAFGGVLISNAFKHSSTVSSPDSAVGSVSVTSPSNLNVVCGAKGVGVKNAAAYNASAKPHYMALFQQSPFTNDGTYTTVMPEEVIGDAVLGRVVRPMSIDKTQLVACVDRTSEVNTGHTCVYQQATLPIYRATYQVTVYEATTRRVVLKKDVLSIPLDVTTSQAATDNCPYTTSYNPQNPRIYYPFSGSSLAETLRPLEQ